MAGEAERSRNNGMTSASVTSSDEWTLKETRNILLQADCGALLPEQASALSRDYHVELSCSSSPRNDGYIFDDADCCSERFQNPLNKILQRA